MLGMAPRTDSSHRRLILSNRGERHGGHGEVDAADPSGYDCDGGREPAARIIELLSRDSLPAVKDRSLLKPTTSRARTDAQAARPRLTVISPRRVEMRRKMVARAFHADDKHAYFESVAEARYVLRKVFRIVEEQAKSADLDPLAHQALIQIYGSPRMELRVNELADRLDIAPPLPQSGQHVGREKAVVPDARTARPARHHCQGDRCRAQAPARY